MAEINAFTRSLREIAARPYALGPYQRGYEWDLEQVSALVLDLKSAFSAAQQQGGRQFYLLGSIVTKEGDPPRLVDGQQRLTTLTLLSIAIRRLAANSESVETSEDGARTGASEEKRDAAIKLRDPPFKSPNFAAAEQPNILMDEDRRQAFLELEKKGDISDKGTELNRKLYDNFRHLVSLVDQELPREDMNKFLDWVADRTVFAEVRINQKQDEFSVFDAMNNRGKPLDPLSQFETIFSRRVDVEFRDKVQQDFKAVREALLAQGKRQDVEFVKVWATARCLEFAVPTHPENGDHARKLFAKTDLAAISQRAIAYVQENWETKPSLGLVEAKGFVREQWKPFGDAYITVRSGFAKPEPNLESLFFLTKTKFNVSMDFFPEVALLAACVPGSERQTPRLALVARYLELICARDSWCRLTNTPLKKDQRNKDRLKYIIARAPAGIRGKRLPEQAAVLKASIADLGFGFADVKDPIWKGGDSRFARMILIGLTQHLDAFTDRPSNLKQLYATTGPDAHDIEHMLPQNMVSGVSEGHRFRSKSVYARNRERLALMVMIPKRLNQSLGGASYRAKQLSYQTHPVNVLTKSLNGTQTQTKAPQAYLQQHGIDFPTMDTLSEELVKKRQAALLKLAEVVWSPDRLDEVVHEHPDH